MVFHLSTAPSSRAHSRREIPPRFEALRGKLFVDKHDEWDQAIGMDPGKFYDLWTADLPGTCSLRVELCGGGQGKIELSCVHDGRQILRAERQFDRPRGTMNLDEVRIETETLRRKGVGKTLFANQLNVAQPWGIKTLTLKAGREDGPLFWARRAALIERFANAAEERQPLTRFKSDIERGLRELDGEL